MFPYPITADGHLLGGAHRGAYIYYLFNTGTLAAIGTYHSLMLEADGITVTSVSFRVTWICTQSWLCHLLAIIFRTLLDLSGLLFANCKMEIIIIIIPTPLGY